jgi:hypothetical protein
MLPSKAECPTTCPEPVEGARPWEVGKGRQQSALGGSVGLLALRKSDQKRRGLQARALRYPIAKLVILRGRSATAKILSSPLDRTICPNQLIPKGIIISKTWRSEHIQLDKLDIEIKEKAAKAAFFISRTTYRRKQ